MLIVRLVVAFFFVKQKTAYEMRISDWSSDVCSSDLSFPSARLCSERLPSMTVHVPIMASRDEDRALRTLIVDDSVVRSEEHTSELQSLMRISYAVFCLKKNKTIRKHKVHHIMTHATTYSNPTLQDVDSTKTDYIIA